MKMIWSRAEYELGIQQLSLLTKEIVSNPDPLLTRRLERLTASLMDYQRRHPDTCVRQSEETPAVTIDGPMIDFDNIDFVVAIWFVGGNAVGDWLAIICRLKGETEWTGRYRFRYYEDDKSFDSDDRKSRWEFKPKADTPIEKMVQAMDQMAALIQVRFTGDIDRLDVMGDGNAAAEKLMGRPWAHVKFETSPLNMQRPPEPGAKA